MAGSTVGHERARSTRTAFDHDSGRREEEGDYDAEYESLTRSSLEVPTAANHTTTLAAYAAPPPTLPSSASLSLLTPSHS